MGWATEPFNSNFIPPTKPFAIADVRYANGGDNAFVEQVLEKFDIQNFYGYAGWNTSANSLGSLRCAVKVKWQSKKYNENAFKKLEMVRFLDDWAYQANVREQIEKPCNVQDLMKPYETRLENILEYKVQNINYTFPWNRKFEIEVELV